MEGVVVVYSSRTNCKLPVLVDMTVGGFGCELRVES